MIHASIGLIVVAAGSARRMNGIDKVWTSLGGKPLIWHSLSTLSPCAQQTVVVVRPDLVDRAARELAGASRHLTVVAGGLERQDSVGAGLDALGEVDTVAVHDAARPFATAEMLQAGVQLLEEWDGALPSEPIHDTVKAVAPNGQVLRTLDRDSLRAVQTPQVFRAAEYRSARQTAASAGSIATDDASHLENAGLRVCVFPGSPANVKVTTPFDLRLAQAMLEAGLTG